MTYWLVFPRLSLRSNLELKLANAFGVISNCIAIHDSDYVQVPFSKLKLEHELDHTRRCRDACELTKRGARRKIRYRVGEVDEVENIESLNAKIECALLTKDKAAHERRVDVFLPGPTNKVARSVSRQAIAEAESSRIEI